MNIKNIRKKEKNNLSSAGKGDEIFGKRKKLSYNINNEAFDCGQLEM